MALNITFDSTLSRVRLTGTALDETTTAVFERSRNNVYWTTVRGGAAVTIDGSDVAKLDDYEFIPGVTNYYRVTAGSDVFSATITPSQSGVWFKSITRPFLNRAVEVTRHSDITRSARNGVFEVMGRSAPIAVTDIRSTRQWSMTVKTETPDDMDALELVFAFGEPVFIQTDGVNDIPGGYVVVGDITRSRFGATAPRRWLELPCTEVAAPAADVYGTPVSWETLVAQYGSWTAVLAAFGTWAAVLEYVTDPSVVNVP
jgi:hypothetical protein